MSHDELKPDLSPSATMSNILVDGVIVVDRNWIVTAISPLCREMLHLTGQEIGQNLWCLLTQLKWNLASKVGCTRAAMESGIPCELEAYLGVPIGRWFHFLLRSSGGGLIVFVRDITDLREVYVKKLQLEQRAAASDFVSLLAHHVNNPLQALTNLLVLARQDCQEPSIQELLNAAEHELIRVASAASEVLRLGKQESQTASSGEVLRLANIARDGRQQPSRSRVPSHNANDGGL